MIKIHAEQNHFNEYNATKKHINLIIRKNYSLFGY